MKYKGQGNPAYKRAGYVQRLIMTEKTEGIDDGYSNMVYFSEDKLYGYATEKTHEYLGRYTDVEGNVVDMPDFIEALESGTDIGGKLHKIHNILSFIFFPPPTQPCTSAEKPVSRAIFLF